MCIRSAYASVKCSISNKSMHIHNGIDGACQGFEKLLKETMDLNPIGEWLWPRSLISGTPSCCFNNLNHGMILSLSLFFFRKSMFVIKTKLYTPCYLHYFINSDSARETLSNVVELDDISLSLLGTRPPYNIVVKIAKSISLLSYGFVVLSHEVHQTRTHFSWSN